MVEFVLKLKETVSGGLRNISSTAQSAFGVVDRALARTQANLNSTGKSVSDISKRLDDLRKTRDLSINRREIISANREIERLERRMERIQTMGTRNRGGMGSAITSLVAGVGLAAGVGGVVNAGFQAQSQKASFEVLGGQQKGGKLFSDLTKFAQDSIFGNELYGNAQMMLSYGISIDKVMPRLKMLGDVSMGDKNKLEQLTRAFSQTQSVGRLMGQDLIQYTNVGFNPLHEISIMTGISMAKLKDKMEKGAITADMVTKAFEHATGPMGIFYNMTQKIADTDFGKWEAFKGQVSGLAMQFGGALAPAAGDLITNYLVPLATWVGENQNLVLGLTGSVIAITAAVKTYTMVQGLWNAVTGTATAVQWLFNTALFASPITWIVLGITALIAILVLAYNKIDWFRGGVVGTWEALKEFARLIYDVVIDRIKTLLSGITGIGKALYQLFTGDFKEAFETGKNAVLDLTGYSTAQRAYEGAKNVGHAWTKGYADGIAESSAKMVVQPITPQWANSPYKWLSYGKNPFAMQPVAAAGSGAAPGGISSSDFSSLSGKNDKITGGGPKIINITMDAMVKGTTIHVSNKQEALDNIDSLTAESTLRLLGSLGGTNND